MSIPVRLQGVAKRFESAVALDHVDLRIEPGEMFFLLGPSGCGKTTLLRCIAGFVTPDEGRIFLGDADVTRQPAHLRNTAMVFQSYALWPHRTVAGNVAFGLEERKTPRAEIKRRVEEALAAVRMSDLAERRITQLSGGQQQRVALARALVVRPRCLLLDEPLSNLDAKLRVELRSEIRRVCRESQLTSIYVTHDQKEALSIADRIAVLDKGRIRQVGTPEEIHRRSATKFVAGFMGETNFIPGVITANATVATSLGEIEAANPGPSGDRVTLSIRPESWRLRAEPESRNCIKGRIDQSVYLGEMAEHTFLVEGRELKIYEMNPRFLSTGREAYACVSPEDVMILRE